MLRKIAATHQSVADRTADMVVGTRLGVTDDAGRAGHAFGNQSSTISIACSAGVHRHLFRLSRLHAAFRQKFSGVSRFEIETEMSVHASQLKLPVSEIGLDYGRRAEGSSSKLTFRDGKDLLMFARLKETHPMRFFSALGGMLLCAPSASRFRSSLNSIEPDWCRACRRGISRWPS
jgi:hypothetical protein